MAMRPARGSRRPATPSRPWVGVQPVYEDFRPTSEWQQDGESDILLIYLPGFQRQHLRVSTEGTDVIRAKGERVDAGNKWSRFQEDYQVPERCNIRAVRARFEGGILTITMPWEEQTRAIPPKEVPPKTLSSPVQKQLMIPPKELKESSIPQKGFDETAPKKQLMSPPQVGKEPTSQKGFDDILPKVVSPQKLMSPPRETKESMPAKGFDDIPPKVVSPPKLMSPPRKPEESITQKGFDDIPPKEVNATKLMSPTKNQKESMPQKGFDDIPPKVLTPPPLTPLSSGKGMDDQKTVIREPIIITPKSRDEQKDRLTDPPNITTPANDMEISVKGAERKGKFTKLKHLERSKGGAAKDDERLEEKNKGLTGQTSAENAARENIGIEEMEKQTTTLTTTRTDNGLRTFKQPVKMLAEMNEERQLLVNVVVAVLVIMALGTYIFTNTIP